MQHAAIDMTQMPARHTRLFELIRQQCRARDVAARLGTAPISGDAALLDVARRAAASWQKMC